MTFEKWLALSEEDRDRLGQSLNPYEEWPLFKEIEESFRREYGSNPAVLDVFCGFASGLGPLNAMTVTIRRGRRVRLPKRYLGLPVLKQYKQR